MKRFPDARVEFCCNDHVVCSIDKDRAINIPLKNFDFQPNDGQYVYFLGEKVILFENMHDIKKELLGRQLEISLIGTISIKIKNT